MHTVVADILPDTVARAHAEAVMDVMPGHRSSDPVLPAPRTAPMRSAENTDSAEVRKEEVVEERSTAAVAAAVGRAGEDGIAPAAAVAAVVKVSAASVAVAGRKASLAAAAARTVDAAAKE